MKRFVVFLALVLATAIPATAHAGWTKTYGGSKDDYGISVEQTSDGGYIILGQTFSFGEGGDAWLLKTNSMGDTLWSRTYGDVGFDYPTFVRQTSDDGYIISGIKTSVKDEDQDLWLVKTDSLGTVEWEKCYGEKDYHDGGWCVQETSDGGYIISGDKGCPKAGCGGWKMWLLKTDSLGDTIWTRTFTPWASIATAFFVQETSEGDYIFVGSLDLSEEDDEDLFLLKTSPQGDSLWMVIYDYMGYNGDQGHCIQEADDGGFIITGISYESMTPRDGDIWLLKTDPQGDTMWTRTFGAEKIDWGLFVCTTSDGGYVLTGMRDQIYPAWSNLWLIKTDADGNEIWSRTYGEIGGLENDWGNCVRETSDGGFIIAGATETWGAGGFDVWLIKTDSEGLLTVEEEPVISDALDWQIISSIGPRIVLRYEDSPNGFHAQVFDASGRMVDEIHAAEVSGTITWPGEQSKIPQGVYFIKEVVGKVTATRKVVLVK